MAYNEKHKSNLQEVMHLSLLLLAVALVFSNTLQNDYHLDSIYRVKNNTELDRFWPPWRYFIDRRAGSTLPQIAEYRPLMPLSHAIDIAISKQLGIDRLIVHHVGNIVAHTVSAILFYFLFRVLLIRWSGIDRRPEGLTHYAFAAALLFAVHPVSGVPVNYIAGRDLLLMLLFLTGSLLVYANMRREGDTVRGWFAVLALYALALFSKQNALMAFSIVFMFEILLAGTRLSDWRLWARAGAFVPGILAIMALEITASDPLGRANIASLQLEMTYPLTMASAHLFYYLKNFAWPFEMRPLAHFDLVESAFETEAMIGCGFIMASLFVAWVFRRRSPLVAFSIVTYWLLFVPTSSVFAINYVVTDYRQYPSLPFLTLLVVMGLGALFTKRVNVVAVAGLIFYFSISAFSLNTIWRTEESFWAQSIRYGGREMAHMNYAMSVARTQPDLAEHHFLETLRLSPQHVYANINLGLFYMRRGEHEKGLALVEKAVSLAPEWALSHYWLGQAYQMLGQQNKALTEYRRAADLDPRSIRYQYEAARALQVAGKVKESDPYLERLRTFDPHYRDTLFLIGWAHQSAGRTGPAIMAYRKFLQSQANHAQTRFNMGYALMKSGRCQKAVEQFHRVLVLDGNRKAAHLHLADCYKKLGDLAKAKKHRSEYSGP